MRAKYGLLVLCALVSALLFTAAGNAAGGRAGSTGVVYVTSQGLYFDTFVTNDPLPMHELPATRERHYPVRAGRSRLSRRALVAEL